MHTSASMAGDDPRPHPAPRRAGRRRRGPRPVSLFGLAAACLATLLAVPALSPPRPAKALLQREAVFQVSCDRSHSAADDPITNPGRPGTAPLNDFFGNVSTDADSDGPSLARATAECDRGMGDIDRSAYWIPALLRNGRPVAGGGARITAYYTVLDKPVPVQPFKFGLRMIAGDAGATSPQSRNIVYFDCINRNLEGASRRSTRSTTIPTCPAGTHLAANVEFPGCWNGVEVDSADHRSHMAYPRGGQCPASHPVEVPTLLLCIRWQGVSQVPGNQLSLSSGGQLSLHAAFWNAWSPGAQAELVQRCLNGQQRCRSTARSEVAAPARFPA